jgi:hypothetical protein
MYMSIRKSNRICIESLAYIQNPSWQPVQENCFSYETGGWGKIGVEVEMKTIFLVIMIWTLVLLLTHFFRATPKGC